MTNTSAPNGPTPPPADELAAWIEERSRTGLTARLGIEVVEVSRKSVVARMPVEGNEQPLGLLHGGASAALAETIGSWAAALAAPAGHAPVGTELGATHLRSATSGWVTGRTRALHEGRRTANYVIEVHDDAGRLICNARLSCMFVPVTAEHARADI